MSNRDIYRLLLAEYKYSAKRRGYVWAIPDGLFMQLICSICYYCGKEPVPTTRKRSKQSVLTHGIDRKDSNEGYSPYNVVTCCKQCNWLKGKYNKDDFLQLVRGIYEHSKKT